MLDLLNLCAPKLNFLNGRRLRAQLWNWGLPSNCSVSDLMVNYGGQVVLQYILELDKLIGAIVLAS